MSIPIANNDKVTITCRNCGYQFSTAPDSNGIVQWTHACESQPNTDSLEEKLRELLKGSYACSRVWEAWQYGTMRQDDFYLLEEDDDVISDLAQLFNKYAMEIIGEDEPALVVEVFADGSRLVQINPRNQLRQEQRAKLKEEGK